MKKERMLNWGVRVILFAVILTLGTAAALVTGESQGLAMADLSTASVQAVTSAAQDNVLYADVKNEATETGIYRSDDKGRTWQLVSASPGPALNALAVHPVNNQVVFAGAEGGPLATTNNLWRSDDGGRTWRKFFLSLPASPDGIIPAVKALAVDPHQPGLLYVGTDGQGVYSFDVGADGYGYTLVGDVSLYDAHVKGLVVSNDSQVYALTNNGLFVNSGDKWHRLETLPELPISLAVAPGDSSVLYAGTPSSGVYRSTDGGQSWESVSAGLDLMPGASLRVTALTVDAENPMRVIVATAYGVGSQLAGGGVYESLDGGEQWRKLGETENLVEQLNLSDGAVVAVTSKGLVTYGESAFAASPAMPIPALQPLANPNGLQIGILILTVIMAGLALVGRLEWLRGKLQARV